MRTRTIAELSGFDRAMPITAFLLVLGSLGGMAFPSFGTFISEYMVILSAISVSLPLAVVVLVPAITSGYFVWMLRRVLMSRQTAEAVPNEAPTFELLTLALFLVPLIILGIYPAPILLPIESTIKSLVGLGLS